MPYGINIIRSDGTEVITQTTPGGRCYAGAVVQAKGTSQTYTSSSIPGGDKLRVLQAEAGAHTWSVSTESGTGYAQLTVTSVGSNQDNSDSTVLLIFCTQTNEPSYGVQLTNDSGDRTASTVFPVPEFLGKLTFSSTPSYDTDAAEGNYWVYQHDVVTSLGAGRRRLILWNLPDTTADVWYAGTTHVGPAITGNYTVTAHILCPRYSLYAVPEAFVFALDGLGSSGDTYGLRIYNDTGALLFDAGLQHMNLRAYETFSYPTSMGTPNNYTMSSYSGNRPAILIPEFRQETWTQRVGLQLSDGKLYMGTCRKNGTTLDTKLIRYASYVEDSGFSSTYTYGESTGLLQLVLDCTLYGGSSAFPLNATLTMSNQTAECWHDVYLGQYSCTTQETWTASTIGGNGNTITYAWSFVSNPGGFSFSSTNTAATTVSKSAAGTNTFTCTIRCTISQSGSTAVVIDKNISHTHHYQDSTPSTCFPAGSLVMMGDGTYAAIETLKPGDLVMGMDGPTQVVRMEYPTLGKRRLLVFTDGHTWSEEHTHWTRTSDGVEWLWAFNPGMWRSEVAQGAVAGLFDNDSLRGPDVDVEFAHVDGWRRNEILIVEADPTTQLYVPVTSGSLIVVDGYVVGAGVNQWGYDYTGLRWESVRKRLKGE